MFDTPYDSMLSCDDMEEEKKKKLKSIQTYIKMSHVPPFK